MLPVIQTFPSNDSKPPFCKVMIIKTGLQGQLAGLVSGVGNSCTVLL